MGRRRNVTDGPRFLRRGSRNARPAKAKPGRVSGSNRYALYWPINLWFSRFQLTERGTIGPGYIWNGVFQITVALVVLITVASAPPVPAGSQRPCAHVLLFAAAPAVLVHLLGLRSTRNFSIRLSHLDAFYFALGTLTIAGTGNISAVSETARGIQVLQMGLALVLMLIVMARCSSLISRPGPEPPRDWPASAASSESRGGRGGQLSPGAASAPVSPSGSQQVDAGSVAAAAQPDPGHWVAESGPV